MFDIEYKGASGVIITTKKSTTVVDPKLSIVGLKDLSVKNAVEIATEIRFAIDSDEVRLLIEGPGEYEIGDLSIRGIAATRHIDNDNKLQSATIYRIEIGDIRVGLLGNIVPRLEERQLEELGIIDILIIPVGGGGYTLDATSAATLVRQIDPKVVIPIHYADNAIKYEVPQDTVDTFTKELGAPVETVSKYKVKGVSSLPQTLAVIQVTRD